MKCTRDSYIFNKKRTINLAATSLTRFNKPTNFLNMFVLDEFLDKMFMQNQLYKSSNQISEDISLEDIIKILGIILYMRIFKLPNLTRANIMADCMQLIK